MFMVEMSTEWACESQAGLEYMEISVKVISGKGKNTSNRKEFQSLMAIGFWEKNISH